MREGLVDATTLAKLRDLKFIAKRIIQGGAYGLHSSKQRGVGFEFSQYRSYQPGDDLRYVDWRLFARSDRVFVRESERESQQNVWFVCDLSDSMNQISGQVNQWSKLAYARCLIAALSHLVSRQGDHFGFLGLGEQSADFLPDGLGQQHLEKMFFMLDRVQAKGSWPGLDATPSLWDHLQNADLSVLVTDFFELRGEFSELCKKLAAAGKELLVIQLLTRDEMQFPYRGNISFEDRETQGLVQINANNYRETYLQRLKQGLSDNKKHVAGLGGQYEVVEIEQPLDSSIWKILKTRESNASQRGRLS